MDMDMESSEGERFDALYLTVGYTYINKQKVTPNLKEDIEFIFSKSIECDTLPEDDDQQLYKLTTTQEIAELPRRLPRLHDISDSILLLFEMPCYNLFMGFIIDHYEDMAKISMFHVFNNRFKEIWDTGSASYALNAGKLYYVGGRFHAHSIHRLLADAMEHVEEEVKRGVPDDPGLLDHAINLFLQKELRNLEVPVYNLVGQKSEDRYPRLCGPKPYPIVFVYDGKIFVLKGRPRNHYRTTLPNVPAFKSPAFEFLDTTADIPTFHELPAPPFDMEYFHSHFFDSENGILSLFFCFPGLDYSASSFPGCELDLKKTERIWCHNAKNWDPDVDSFPTRVSVDPDSTVGRGKRHISYNQHGCIVDGILFTYDSENPERKKLILGHKVGGDENVSPFKIDGLDDHISEIPFHHNGFLNHIRENRFCLIICYPSGSFNMTNAVYCCTFDLDKVYLNEDQIPKAKEFTFKLKFICGKTFQVPSGFILQLCQKLESELVMRGSDKRLRRGENTSEATTVL